MPLERNGAVAYLLFEYNCIYFILRWALSLLFGYAFPASGRAQDYSPVRFRPCRAPHDKAQSTTKGELCFFQNLGGGNLDPIR